MLAAGLSRGGLGDIPARSRKQAGPESGRVGKEADPASFPGHPLQRLLEDQAVYAGHVPVRLVLPDCGAGGCGPGRCRLSAITEIKLHSNMFMFRASL